ncbi:hypothetical protein Tco_0186094 [Tanacetum coccineum]
MASSACSSTQNPPKKAPKEVTYIDLTSNEASPQQHHATIDTTLALTIPPPMPNMVEPFASPLGPRALVFTTPPNTPNDPHPFLSSLNDAPPRPTNPFPHSLTQNLPKPSQNEAPVEPTIPSLPPNSHQVNAQTNPSVEREIIQQEIHNLQAFHQNIQEAIHNAQHVQDSLIPPTSITHIQIPPPFYPTSTPIQTPPYGPSFPPPNVFGPLDQSLWLEQPPQPLDHTCPHCQKTENIINNFQTETRFMLNHILDRLNHISNRLPRDDH